MKNKPLLIFDFDGVVVDSEPIAIGTLHRLLIKYCIPLSIEDCEDSFLGKSFTNGIENLREKYGRSIDKLPINFAEICSNEINNNLSQYLKPIQGIHYALNSLSHKKCIASGSNKKRLDISLDVTKTKQYFSKIFSSAEMKYGKPNPEIFIHAYTKLGYTSENSVVIEDSEAGMNAGLNAGIKTILYQPNRLNDFYVPQEVIKVSSMYDLPKVIKNINSASLSRV